MAELTNTQRAERGNSAVESHMGDQNLGKQEALTDLLRNLRHWAHRNNVNFTAAERFGKFQYRDDVREGKQEGR